MTTSPAHDPGRLAIGRRSGGHDRATTAAAMILRDPSAYLLQMVDGGHAPAGWEWALREVARLHPHEWVRLRGGPRWQGQCSCPAAPGSRGLCATVLTLLAPFEGREDFPEEWRTGGPGTPRHR